MDFKNLDFKKILDIEHWKKEIDEHKICIGAVVVSSVFGLWIFPVGLLAYIGYTVYGSNNLEDVADAVDRDVPDNEKYEAERYLKDRPAEGTDKDIKNG